MTQRVKRDHKNQVKLQFAIILFYNSLKYNNYRLFIYSYYMHKYNAIIGFEIIQTLIAFAELHTNEITHGPNYTRTKLHMKKNASREG